MHDSTHMSLKVKVLAARSCLTPHQAPLSVGFSRPQFCSRLPFHSLGDLPDPGSEGRSALQADSLPTERAIRELTCCIQWDISSWFVRPLLLKPHNPGQLSYRPAERRGGTENFRSLHQQVSRLAERVIQLKSDQTDSMITLIHHEESGNGMLSLQ